VSALDLRSDPLVKRRASETSPDGCAWCGTPYRFDGDREHLYQFAVVTRRGIAWDRDEQFCSRWCFVDFYEDGGFADIRGAA
jgi:hypothetical protein